MSITTNTVKKAKWGSPEKMLKIGEAAVECYVLDDETRVLSGRGMQNAIGFGGEAATHGSKLRAFINDKAINPFVSNELAMALENPVKFIRPGRGGKAAIAFEATLLIDLCEAVMKAYEAGSISKSSYFLVRQSQIITSSFARAGIIAAVDEVTGFQEVRAKDAIQAILERYLRKELAVWAERFPKEFYKEMFRLRGWNWNPMSVARPSVIGRYTNDIVYERLAPNILAELEAKNPKNESGNRLHRHHQWLTDDVGHPALSQHIHAIIGLMRASTSWDNFYRLLQRAFPKKNDQLSLLIED